MAEFTEFNSYLKRNNYLGKEHQKDGIRWCKKIEIEGVELNKKKIRGGILGDEMGLGKTAQMIGLILENFKLNTLIIVPRGLLEQWEETIKKTLNHVPLVYHGQNKKEIDLEKMKKSAIVLSTYGTMSQYNKEKKRYGLLQEMNWDRVIFDEAHHLRNRTTKSNKGGKKLKAMHKWLVTGTPIQNGVKDFYGLCEVLGLSEDYYTRNVEEIAEKIYLKRTKKDINLELPNVKQKKVMVNWESKEEREFSEDIHSLLNFSKIKEKRENNVFQKSGMHHFALLHKARQTCIDTSLMEENLEKMKDLHLIDKKLDVKQIENYKSKINAVCRKIVKNKDNKNKKLVFCHFTNEINKIVEIARLHDINVRIFNGSTSIEERKNILKDEEIDMLVLQINTGCEGLNLQRFNEIYFVSAHWNPAVEQQAIARCHRMGQEKEVIVYNFEMKAFDERCHTRNLDGYISGVQKRKIKEMKIIDKAETLLDEEGNKIECAICLEAMTNKDYDVLDCNHMFHKNCLTKWLSVGEYCPVCRI